MKRDINKENKIINNVHSGHRRRLMNKIINTEYNLLEEHEILESILFCVIPRANTNEIAHALIKKFGSIYQVFDAPYEQLIQVEGVGPKIADFMYLLGRFSSIYGFSKAKNAKQIKNLYDIEFFFKDNLVAKKKEEFHIIAMNNEGTILNRKVLSFGKEESVYIDIKEVQNFILHSAPQNVLIMHNHPTGEALPSKADILTTQNIFDMLNYLNIYLLDHVIFSGSGDTYSFNQNGLLQKFEDEFKKHSQRNAPNTKLSQFKRIDAIKQ